MTHIVKILSLILPVIWLAAALMVALVVVMPAAAQFRETKPPEDLSLDPVPFTNEGGDFKIVFPGGCGKLVAKSNEPDLWGDETWDDIIQVTMVYCDRYQKEGEGCSVSATFNMPGDDSQMAGPGQVVKLVEKAMRPFRAKIVKQHQIQKEYPNGVLVEGVEIFARTEETGGEVWVRGLLSEGDIYVLIAWNEKGGLWHHPDYKAYFNSFQPWVD